MNKTLHNIIKYTFRAFIMAFALILGSVTINAFPTTYYASKSELSEGAWVKIKVDESGIYAISSSDIQRWGFKNLDKVKIYGYGGAPISEVLNTSQIDDLKQVPTLMANNKLYFYAQGPTTWKYNNNTNKTFSQIQHPYAMAGYYFVTDKEDEEPLRITSVNAAPTGDAQSTFTEHTFYENEQFSPSASGRYLLGDDFKYTPSKNFKFKLTDLEEGSTVFATIGFAAKCTGGRSRLAVSYNGTNLPQTAYDEIPELTNEYANVNSIETTKSFTLSNPDLSLGITFSYAGILYTSNLDYITLNYRRKLNLNNGVLAFRCYKDGSKTLKLNGASESTHIWNITTTNAPVEVKGTNANGAITFDCDNSKNSEYFAFNEGATSISAPTFVEKVANQNIHGEPTPDMIIITPKEFKEQAKRIADIHADRDSMRTLILCENEIFNEFSSGTPDLMAHRKMAKMFYDRGADEKGHKLGYLLMFGRGTYDNRKITTAIKNLNIPTLLTWQSVSGTNEIYSYTTDDILVMLEDGSGANISNDKMSIAVGRMPVKSLAEAKSTVDKLYNYIYKQNHGAWKNNILVIADDENNGIHMKQAEKVIETMQSNGAQGYVQNRIYLDAYLAESTGSGRGYPGARKDFFQKINEGVLYLDYIGHSSTVTWSHEGLLTTDDINKNMFYKNLPLMYTASCEFTRMDGISQSGGESLFLNERGGAIALISSARQVSIADNGILNTNVAAQVFKRNADNSFNRIGDILKNAKNAYPNNSNKLRYFLIGDPAMRLAYPEYQVKLETINGQTVNENNMPVLQARQTMNITGSIYDNNGKKASDFNGSIIPTLYDAEESVETHGYGEDGVKYLYQNRSNKLAVGKDSVRNGDFNIKIAIPSEVVSLSKFDNYTPALINFYANSNDGREANGSNEDFYIYGFDSEATSDTTGPEITSFFLNSDAFKSGDNVNESPMVIAKFSDESGINFSSSGIGHQMTLLLDEKTTYSDVSVYFTPESNNGGTICYPISNLSEGHHTLRIKVWDTFNNSSEQTIEFNVVKGLEPELIDVYTTSNPATVDAKFYIKHNRPDGLITVTLSIYDLLGREVWSTKQTGKSDMFTSFPITWNLTDASGRRVNRGIYIYRAGVSTDGRQEATKAKKIAVGNE